MTEKTYSLTDFTNMGLYGPVQFSDGHGGMAAQDFLVEGIPRLRIRHFRPKFGAPWERHYLVDAATYTEVEHAIDALNNPTPLEDIEEELLAAVPAEWSDYADWREQYRGDEPHTDVPGFFQTFYALKMRGLIQYREVAVPGAVPHPVFGAQTKTEIRRRPEGDTSISR